MESIAKIDEKYAVVFNVNLLRATLNEASEFKDYLEEAIRDTDKDIVVNLSNCEHLDSTFLGVLVRGYKRLKNNNRNLVIIEPVDQSSIYLTLNSIVKIFPLYTSVKTALEDIENKKLLEIELGELNNSPKKENKTKNADTYKISAPPENIPVEATLIEKLNPPEEPKSKNQENKTEQESINLSLDENVPDAEKFSLIENRDNSDNTDKVPTLNSAETLKAADPPSHPKSKQNKYNNTVISEPQTISREESFSKGTVEWEFGFS